MYCRFCVDLSIQVDTVLPTELYDLTSTQLREKIPECRYSKVNMPLSAVLEGDFFTSYIKSGTACTLSVLQYF